MNTKGKVKAAVACAVAVIAVGILLGIIINPAAYAICIVSVICLGAIYYFLKQDESYVDDLINKKLETTNIYKAMIKAMRILRYKIASESLSKSKISSFAFRFNDAEDASLKAVKELLKDKNNQVTKEYLSIKDFVTRIATPTYYGNFHNASYTQKDVKNAADQLIYGHASRSINFYSPTKSYHKIEKTLCGHQYKLA